jgi:hypothetical protein
MTTTSWESPALSGSPAAQLQYATHEPVPVVEPSKKTWPCPPSACARNPDRQRKAVPSTFFPPSMARSPAGTAFAACVFWKSLPMAISLPPSPAHVSLHTAKPAAVSETNHTSLISGQNVSEIAALRLGDGVWLSKRQKA